MSVRVRLTRVGSRKNPVWRVVVADQRSPRDGRVIETVGRYNAQTEPSEIVLDEERIRHWLARGAQPSDTVRKLMRVKGLDGPPRTRAESPVAGEPPADPAAPEAGPSEAPAPDAPAPDAPAPDAPPPEAPPEPSAAG